MRHIDAGFGVASFLCLLAPVQAWDPLGIKGAVDKLINGYPQLVGTAKEAFEDAIHEVLDRDLNPLIDKVNAMVLDDANEIKQDVEEFVHNSTEEILSLIRNSADIAQKFADHELKEIKEQIIDAAGRQVMNIEDHFFAGVSDILHQFYKLVEKVNCMVRGDIDNILKEVKKVISLGCAVPGKCCWKTGLQFKTLESMGDTQLYDLQVCRRSEGIGDHTPRSELVKLYVDLQVLAKQFYCIDFGTGSARTYFTREYNKWGVKFNSWDHPFAVQTQSSKQLGLGEDPCKDAVDCFEQAIKKLNEARQEIQGKADESQLQSMVAQLDTKANALKTELEAKTNLLGKNISSQSAQLSATQSEVDTLSEHSSQHSTEITGLRTEMGSLSISTACRFENSASSYDGGGEGKLDYLDRHSASCANDERLVYWTLNRDDGNHIHITYQCCPEKIVGNTMFV